MDFDSAVRWVAGAGIVAGVLWLFMLAANGVVGAWATGTSSSAGTAGTIATIFPHALVAVCVGAAAILAGRECMSGKH